MNLKLFARSLLVLASLSLLSGVGVLILVLTSSVDIDPLHPNSEVVLYAIAQVMTSVFVIYSSQMYVKRAVRKWGFILLASFFCYVIYIWTVFMWF